jgi:hypothetical protein
MARVEIQTKKDRKTDTASADVIVFMIVSLPLRGTITHGSISPFFALD